VTTAADRLAQRRLYLCTPDRPDLRAFLEACLRGGVDLVQLRDKVLEARPLLERARVAAEVCAEHGVPFILNDRPDLALECGADGVHVGQDDAPAALARRILGPDAIIGLSTHQASEWDAATIEPADYLSAGPVTQTPTKPGRPGTGLGYLAYAGARATRPWFVTGGVTPQAVGGLVASGASRFVVVRFLTESTAPYEAARRLRTSIEAALAGADAPPA
jgi:thiamine-phosphate pyrophosphorylase